MKNPLALFHRIQTRPYQGRVVVEIDGEVVADSESALELDERGLPPRLYLPREDLRVELLPADKRTYCLSKGQATHYSVRAAGATHDNVVWSYEDPKERVAEIKDLVAFYDDGAVISVSPA